MQHQIILVFCEKDADIVARVRDSLFAADFTVWSGDADELKMAVQNGGCCVVILSPDANGDASVEGQLNAIHEANLKIFPVIGRGDEWSAIPKAFIGTQIIDVRANHDARMIRLIGLIKDHLNIRD